ncbi:hypothetical protein PM082_012050 [Marasmius tenuissimus]|nr:hypothetical protein PM082_012050 [Marasmius tenuissimus]
MPASQKSIIDYHSTYKTLLPVYTLLVGSRQMVLTGTSYIGSVMQRHRRITGCIASAIGQYFNLDTRSLALRNIIEFSSSSSGWPYCSSVMPPKSSRAAARQSHDIHHDKYAVQHSRVIEIAISTSLQRSHGSQKASTPQVFEQASIINWIQ